MRKLFYLMTLIMTLSLSSCFGEAQIAYDDEYYDTNNHWTVVYLNQIPYYRYRVWENYEWVYRYRLVPRERIPYIHIQPNGFHSQPLNGFRGGVQSRQPIRSIAPNQPFMKGNTQGRIRFTPSIRGNSTAPNQSFNRGGNGSGQMRSGRR